MRPLRVYMIAGEASGDRLGAPLIRALAALRPLELRGVGGEHMRAAGLPTLFPASDLAVMGLTEVLPRLPLILRRMRETVADAVAFRPDALITIDSPAFSLRVARRVKAQAPGTKAIHYVAPSVWAWRPGRAREMARYVDHVLALLPFEPPWMEAAGMTCDCVGHPASQLVPPPPEARAAFRESVGAKGPLLCLLPGSRTGEISRLLGPFFEVLKILRERVPGLVAVLPAAPGKAAMVSRRDWPAPVKVLDPDALPPEEAEARKFLAMAASDAALAASGTVTLELAAMGTPQVIGYRLNPITAGIARHLIRVRSANLVNLLTDSMEVPEFLQEHFRPPAVAAALERLLTDPEARARQRAAADRALELLGRGGPPPSRRAAESVLRALG
mgnify:CR=1 FL=1